MMSHRQGKGGPLVMQIRVKSNFFVSHPSVTPPDRGNGWLSLDLPVGGDGLLTSAGGLLLATSLAGG